MAENHRERVSARYALAAQRPEAWIDLRDEAEVASEVGSVLRRTEDGEELPLAGTLFAVKGNIDVAGLPTTAACPSYAYHPHSDATVVARLRAAGAVVMGSTNLDQFATGLVGARSPYGAVRHAADPARISGGSSSGSAVAVALGAVDFALGTDTAGSGRVPAALHGLFGLKPTKGWISATGVVPACWSHDVVTVMSRDLRLGRKALEIMSGFDEQYPLSRHLPPTAPATAPRSPVIGVPPPEQIGQLATGWAEAFAREVEAWRDRATTVEIDIEPFLATARLLYEGAFVAERYTAVGEFIDAALADERAADIDPIVGGIITAAKDLPAWRVFADQQALAQAAVYAREVFSEADALLLPTTTQHPTLASLGVDPVGINTDMGRFTNFANLLDLAAVAYPAGDVEGLPFGVQLLAPAFHDRVLIDLVDSRAQAATRRDGLD